MANLTSSFLACALFTLASAFLGCADIAPSGALSEEPTIDALSEGQSPVFNDQGTPPAGGPPVYHVQEIGHPTWKPVDLQQAAINFGVRYSNWSNILDTLLPAPEHVWRAGLGKGPGAPHAGPYDTEMSENIAGLGWNTGSIFDFADVDYPNGVLNFFMVVPTDDAPLGSSPDFTSGPIIPNTLFPIKMKMAFYDKGSATPKFGGSGSVPALDKISQPFSVDGHSHFPMFIGHFPFRSHWHGEESMVIEMLDVNGNGWELTSSYVVQPGPNDGQGSDGQRLLALSSEMPFITNVELSNEPE